VRAHIEVFERTPVNNGLARYTHHDKWEHPGEWEGEFVPVVGDIIMMRVDKIYRDFTVIKRHISPSANPRFPAPIISLIVERCRPLYADEAPGDPDA
jgi:hypothetical protein